MRFAGALSGSGSGRTSSRRATRIRLRLLEFSPVVAALLLGAVWFGVPAELNRAMARGGSWHASATGLTFTEATQMARALGYPGASSTAADRRETARGYYAALRALEWERGSPDRDFRTAARKVANALANRTDVFYRPDGSPKPIALPRGDAVYAPLRSWAASWGATPYALLLPDPPEPSVVASAVARPDWLASSEQLAALKAVDTPDYLWKLKHHGSHPTFNELGGWAQDDFVAGEPRRVSSQVQEGAGEYWVFMSMSPGGTWIAEQEGGYYEPRDTLFDAPAVSLTASGTSPASAEYQETLRTLTRGYRTNVWVLGPLALRAVPQIVPEGVTVEQAAKFGEAVLRSSAAPGGGEFLDYRLSEIPTSALAYARGSKYQVLAQVTGASTSMSGSDPPQTMLFVATWAKDPYPPLTVGRLATAWDSLRAWFAASRSALLVVCFVFLGMTLVASPVGFVIDRRMTERERVAAEMQRVQRDAHDRVYNRMAALSIRLETESSEASDSESSVALTTVAAELADMRRDLQEILGSVRTASAEAATKAANPSEMVADQLAALVKAQQSMGEVLIDFQADGDLPPIVPEAGWDLQCITEEAIVNAVRHGHATKVAVSLAKEPAGLVLEIADNGSTAVPIDIESLPVSSTGLRGMRARADRLGGSLEVQSGETGVRVIVHVPSRSSRRVG